MRSSLAQTGFHLAAAAAAIALYFLVDPVAAVTLLLAVVALDTLRPFLHLLDAGDRVDGQDPDWREAAAFLTRLSRDTLVAEHARSASGGSIVGDLLVVDVAPDWGPVDEKDRPELETILGEAEALVRREAHDEAARRYRRLIRFLPGEAAFHHNLGVLHLIAGDVLGARANLLRALFFHPDDPRIYQALIEASPGPAELAEQAFRRARTLRPDDPAPCFHMARFHLARGSAVAAEEVLERYLAESPADPGPAFRLRGWARLLSGRFAEAMSDFQAHQARVPWNRQARLGEGLARLAAGDARGADRCMAAALDLSRQGRAVLGASGALLGRALAAFTAGEHERAIGLCDAIRAIDADHRGAILIGSLSDFEGRRAAGLEIDAGDDPALAELRRLARADEGASDLLVYLVGRAYLLVGSSAQSVPFFEEAVQDWPDRSRERLALAVAYLRSGRSARVAELLDPVVDDAAVAGLARVLVAVGHVLEGDRAGGLERLGRLTTGPTPEPLAHQALARIHGQRGTLEGRLTGWLAEVSEPILPAPEVGELINYLVRDARSPFL